MQVRYSVCLIPTVLLVMAFSVAREVETRVDLTRAGDNGARATGTILYIEGFVTDTAGKPVGEIDLKFWQTDARGYYREEAEKRGLLDRAFAYRVTLRPGSDGRFTLVTILPASYAEHPQVMPHIHVAMETPGRSAVNREIVFSNHPTQRRAPQAGPRLFVAELKAADQREPGALQCAVTLVADR